MKGKLHRTIYKNRDKANKALGGDPLSLPANAAFHDTSHKGTGQFHTHLIVEKLPVTLNAQDAMETLFRKRFLQKVKALSKWKSIDINEPSMMILVTGSSAAT